MYSRRILDTEERSVSETSNMDATGVSVFTCFEPKDLHKSEEPGGEDEEEREERRAATEEEGPSRRWFPGRFLLKGVYGGDRGVPP